MDGYVIITRKINQIKQFNYNNKLITWCIF